MSVYADARCLIVKNYVLVLYRRRNVGHPAPVSIPPIAQGQGSIQLAVDRDVTEWTVAVT